MPDPVRRRGRRAADGNVVPSDEVRSMFDRIAPIYDRMNTVMTVGLDARWRRAAVRETRLRAGMRALDVACGTGALTRELAAAVGSTGSVVGVDASTAMLDRARQRTPATAAVRYERADALELPFGDGRFDASTIAFGLRNVADYRRCLEEMTRVTCPGGRVVVLEIAIPRGRLGGSISALWFRRLVPILGRIAGGGRAYAYLPASVEAYPPPRTIAAHLRDAGLTDVRWRRLGFGLVTLHAGTRA